MALAVDAWNKALKGMDCESCQAAAQLGVRAKRVNYAITGWLSTPVLQK
jgi:hypothetical protein